MRRGRGEINNRKVAWTYRHTCLGYLFSSRGDLKDVNTKQKFSEIKKSSFEIFCAIRSIEPRCNLFQWLVLFIPFVSPNAQLKILSTVIETHVRFFFARIFVFGRKSSSGSMNSFLLYFGKKRNIIKIYVCTEKWANKTFEFNNILMHLVWDEEKKNVFAK